MAVLNITYSPTGLSSVNPNLLYITTDDVYTDVLVSGYLNKSRSVYGNIFSNYQMALVYTTDNYTVLLQIVIAGGNTSLQQFVTGAGDVTGPNTATDNALVRFNGTSGELIQNSTSILDDSGNLIIPLSVQTIDFTAGSNGVGGSVTIYPDNPLGGQLNITMTSNPANDLISLSIGNFAQATSLSIPDPNNAIGKLLIAGGSTPFVDGNIPKAVGVLGAMIDSGIAANNIITGTPSALTTGSDTNIGLTLGGMSSTALLQAVSITPTWTGTLSGARGGTGVANTGKTITLGGNLETSGAFNAVFTLTGSTNVTFPTSGTLATTSGASIPSVAQGDLLYGSATNVLSVLNKDTNATRYLSNTGTSNNPAWSQINLTNGVTGILPGANGGTGVANTGKTITLGGNLQTSGAFNATFTLTGNTSVTLPTSGTLVASSSLGTMASQNANAVAITGGTIDNVNINDATIDGGTIDNVTDFSAGNFTINGATLNGQYTSTDLFMGLIDGGGNDRAVMRTSSSGTTGSLTLSDASANTMVLTPTSLVTNGTFSRLLPSATQGDILYASAATTWSLLPKNTTTIRYLSNGGTNNNPDWQAVSMSSGVSGILQFTNGGLGLNTAAQGDILYASAANTLSTLAKSAIPNRYLKNSGTNNNPQWAALDVSSVTGELSWNNINVPLSISGKNLILNGDFQVSQSGTSFSVAANSNSYTIDRWQLKTSASQASTVTQVAGATSGSFQAKVQRNSGQTGTGALSFGTSLTRSMCVGAAGNPLTLTVRLKAGANFSAASSQLTVQVISGTGSTDVSSLTTGFTGSNTELSVATAITTTETEYVFGLANLGSSVTQLYVGFTYNPVGTAGADDSFTVSDVKLEIGENSTPFIHEPLQDVLPKIYYFHYRLEFNNNGAARFGIMGQAVSTTSAQFAFQHLTTMRVAPTFTSGTVTNFQVTGAAGPGITTTNLTSSQMFPNSALLIATVASGLVAGGSTQLLTVSNANAWLDFSAELT